MFGGNHTRVWVLLAEPQSKICPRIEAPISAFDSLPYITGYTEAHLVAKMSAAHKVDCDCSSTCERCSSVVTAFDMAFNMEVLSEANENLTPSQKELLLDHQRFGHINMSHLQELYHPRDIVCKFDGCSKDSNPCLPACHAGVSSCDQPMCLACAAARSHHRPTGTTHSKKDPEHQNVIAAERLQPGDQIHVDNYESSVHGHLTHTYGKEKWHQCYCGGTIFYDASSGLIKVYHQSSLDADSTLTSKRLFEHDATQCGVNIHNYHADNGIFTSAKWKEVLLNKDQHQTLSATGAHHQNPHAECAIGTVTNSAHAMLMHVQIHWPDEYDTHLWPLALDYATWIYNHTPKHNGLAPIEIFCGTRTGCDYLRRAKMPLIQHSIWKFFQKPMRISLLLKRNFSWIINGSDISTCPISKNSIIHETLTASLMAAPKTVIPVFQHVMLVSPHAINLCVWLVPQLTLIII